MSGSVEMHFRREELALPSVRWLRKYQKRGNLEAVSLLIVLLLCMIVPMTILNQNAAARFWEPIQVISTDIATEKQWNVSLAAEDDEVHAVWADFGDGDYDIYYRYYNGTSWQPEQEISIDDASEWQMNPSIVVENGKVYIVWEEWNLTTSDIYYGHFDGATWQPQLRLSTDVLRVNQEAAPEVAVDNGRVHVVWHDYGDGDWDIFYMRFDGATWQPKQQISPDPWFADHTNPSIAAENGRVHVVWENSTFGLFGIRYKHFDGISWQPDEELSTDFMWDKILPSVAANGGKVHTVWADRKYDGDSDIFYRYFDGVSWQPDQEISSDVGTETQFAPVLAVDGVNVHVVWMEGGLGDTDIYYRYFDGTSWQPEEEIATFVGIEWTTYPSISIGTGVVHVAWADSRDGDNDILYTRSTEDIMPPESKANLILPFWQTTSTFNIDWIATDDYGLANISLYYRYSPDNITWLDWEEWAYDNTISGTLAVGSFLFTSPHGDGFYEFYTIANDTSGNGEPAPTSADAIVCVDTTPPTGSIIINSGDTWTTTTSVTLMLTYVDALSGVSQVRYSNDGVWDTEPWEAPSPTKAWNLASGDGTKDVYYQVRDNAGLLSNIYSDDIGLDTTPPSGSIIVNDGDAWTTSAWVTLSLTYLDPTSGVSQVRYSNDGTWDSESWEIPFPIKEWPLTRGDGTKTVYYQIKDNVGLLSITYSDMIGLDTTEPTGSIMINDGDAWTTSTLVALTLGYSDITSGVSLVRYSNNDGVWDTELWATPSPMEPWTIESDDGIKIIYYQVKDNSGLESITYLDYIGLDTKPPTGSIVINDGAELTSSASVSLRLTYSDKFSGVSQVRYSNDGLWDTEPWESPSSTRAWMLTSGDGKKKVYYQIKDNAGLESITYSDDIELDTTPPAIVSISPYDGERDLETTTNIVVTFTERMNQSATSSSFNLMNDTVEVEGSLSWTIDGSTLFFIPKEELEKNTTYRIIITTWAKDIAGNSLVTVSETIFTTKEVGEKPGEEPLTAIDYWWIILVLIIVTIIVVFIAWRTRKKHPSEEKDSAREGTTSEATQSRRLDVEENADREEGLE